MYKLRTICTVLASISLLTLVSPCQAAFQEPLDTPAVSSTLAPKAIVNGLALAGGRIVSVGQRGHILFSDDGGNTWAQATVPVSVDLTAVFFASAKRGWAVGHGGVVLSSVDGGSNWTKQLDGRAVGKLMVDHYASHAPASLSPDMLERLRADVKNFVDEGADKPFLDLWFENESTGYVVGSFNLILKTSDGGKTWLPWFDRMENPNLLHIYAIRAVGENIYLAGEQGLILKLDKSTQHFRKLPIDYKGSFFGITGKKDSLIVYGLRGNAYRSADGGASWQKIDTGISVGVTSATVTPGGRILMASQDGQVLASSDEGVSFSKLKLERQAPTAALLEIPGQSLVTGGARGLLRHPMK